MLKQFLEAAELTPAQCAGALGVDVETFRSWLEDASSIPNLYGQALAAMLGITLTDLRDTHRRSDDSVPAIWFRLRHENVTEADRTYVALIRRLAFLYDQFEQAMQTPSVLWETIFQGVRNATPETSSPREQGKRAAQVFRTTTGLQHGARGIGEVFRGNLRQMGILVVETPLPASKIEGCSFVVASPLTQPGKRPCIFANTHANTWFRRNFVLLHEVCHLIFDDRSTGLSIDFADTNVAHDVAEERADAFAQEMLVPTVVLKNEAQRNGIHWDSLDAEGLARLVAETHAEQRVVLRAARSEGLIEDEQYKRLLDASIAPTLSQMSERALTSIQYFKRFPEQKATLENRKTTIPSVTLRLPASYVKAVTEAAKLGTVSVGKAAEFLMIDRRTFATRFPDFVPEG